MMEGGRLVAVLCLVFLLTETGLHVVSQLSSWCSIVQSTNIRTTSPTDVSVVQLSLYVFVFQSTCLKPFKWTGFSVLELTA
jgi:hypothetical protein